MVLRVSVTGEGERVRWLLKISIPDQFQGYRSIMPRSVSIIITLIILLTLFSFYNQPTLSPSSEVKKHWLEQAAAFNKAVISLRSVIISGNERSMQAQFLKARDAYKRMESMVEYYYNFYAVKLNGPPIPFYEEDEAEEEIDSETDFDQSDDSFDDDENF